MNENYELIREWKQDGFRLELFDTGTTDSYGKCRLAYRLYHAPCYRGTQTPSPVETLIFEGEDFCCSPLHAIDSDECLGALLGFLSLKPDDTDKEYFDSYTPEQLDFANEYGEELSSLAYELEEGIWCCASIYGDGALLDFRMDESWLKLRSDDSECEPSDEDEDEEEERRNPTAYIRLRVSPSIAKRAYDYTHGNCGPEPYSDGYEAMECFTEAKESEVISCGVPWTKEECERLGGCFLCGGNHDD